MRRLRARSEVPTATNRLPWTLSNGHAARHCGSSSAVPHPNPVRSDHGQARLLPDLQHMCRRRHLPLPGRRHPPVVHLRRHSHRQRVPRRRHLHPDPPRLPADPSHHPPVVHRPVPAITAGNGRGVHRARWHLPRLPRPARRQVYCARCNIRLRHPNTLRLCRILLLARRMD